MNPWLDNVVAYGIQIAIVVGVGTALPFAFRLRSPGIMLPYWQGLLFACVVLPLQPWNQTPTALPGAPSIGVVSVQNIVSAARHHNASGWIYSGIQLVLMGGVLVRLGWLGIGMCRLRRYRREARLVQILPDAVIRMQSITGVQAEVRISGEIDSPGAFGFFRPVILLPGGFLQMNDRSQRAIACHELLHVRRRDWLCIFLEKVVGALLWFHPAVWWLLGRIELSREQVIDREVVQITGSPKAYLEALLKIAQHKGQPEVTLAPSFLNRHHLAMRVAMILTEVPMSKLWSIVFLGIIGAVLLVTGGVAIWAFPLHKAAVLQDQDPTPEKPRREPVRVGGGVKAPKIIFEFKPAYPTAARQQGVQGLVLMEITVNEKGEVWDARVVRGEPLLHDAALKAVRRWRFSPALLDGVPVPVLGHVELEFLLDGSATTAGSPTLKVDETIQAAKLLYQVQPEYSEEARRLGIEGDVVLRITVDEGGAVIGVQPVSGHSLLIGAATQAVRQWKYSPTSLSGDLAKVESTVTVAFKLR